MNIRHTMIALLVMGSISVLSVEAAEPAAMPAASTHATQTVAKGTEHAKGHARIAHHHRIRHAHKVNKALAARKAEHAKKVELTKKSEAKKS